MQNILQSFQSYLSAEVGNNIPLLKNLSVAESKQLDELYKNNKEKFIEFLKKYNHLIVDDILHMLLHGKRLCYTCYTCGISVSHIVHHLISRDCVVYSYPELIPWVGNYIKTDQIPNIIFDACIKYMSVTHQSSIC